MLGYSWPETRFDRFARLYANGWPMARLVSGARLVVIQVTARVEIG